MNGKQLSDLCLMSSESASGYAAATIGGQLVEVRTSTSKTARGEQRIVMRQTFKLNGRRASYESIRRIICS